MLGQQFLDGLPPQAHGSDGRKVCKQTMSGHTGIQFKRQIDEETVKGSYSKIGSMCEQFWGDVPLLDEPAPNRDDQRIPVSHLGQSVSVMSQISPKCGRSK